jgi:NosR/NirI family nitrous oxide reductase transcriptional regulator
VRRGWPAWVGRALLLAAALWLSGLAEAGVMTRATLQERFPAPLVVGERDAQLPVWPVFKQDATATRLVGYLFESVDLAALPGFSGTPMNLLVALDAKGVFLDVRVLSQHEPVFLDGLGVAPLERFVEQYKGLSLQQNIRIGGPRARGDEAGIGNAGIDGIAKATASVRIVNQSLLSAALRVARARLGFAEGRDPDRLARVREDTFVTMDWDALLRAGLVQRVRFTRGSVEEAFAGTAHEAPAETAADDTFAELYVAWLSAPAIGRNLLAEAGWQRLLGSMDPGDHAFLVVAAAGYSFVGEGFVRGAVPERLALRQGALPIELRDLDGDDVLKLPPGLRGADAKVFRVIGPAGLDPAQALDFALRVTRSRGTLYAERVSRDFPVRYRLPESQVQPPEADHKSWHAIWRARAWELAVLGAGLALLSLVLARPAWLVADAKRLARFRTGYLLFTLLFIGWFAQGQLSIVNVTGVLQALLAGHDLRFLLYDPISVSLWVFVALTLAAWGRGTFCGWLCPFGALQELVGQLAQALGVRRLRLHRDLDARLKLLKYLVLAAILVLATVSVPWTERAVEIEPFKTAITLNFVRAWPHVAWAAALLLAGAFVHKAFCRYLCPLGAGLAVLGRVRLLRWIPRRRECGKPCQTCRHRCEYQAIRPGGAIVYEECFQCLECIAIHASEERCSPLLAKRRHRVFALRPEPALAGGVREVGP